MLIGVHFIYAIPAINYWLVAIGLMIILGIAFSLVPSAMWPAVAKIFPVSQLGTAYALIFSFMQSAPVLRQVQYQAQSSLEFLLLHSEASF